MDKLVLPLCVSKKNLAHSVGLLHAPEWILLDRSQAQQLLYWILLKDPWLNMVC